MSENNSISDESYSDDDDDEELDPRIQDELEKLNAATNSINHLEAELDEARAVFRQTLAGATYQLNGVAQKLGKCVEKSRPFYEAYRQLRQSHSMLQKSTNQFERATGMHVAAKSRVAEAERRVFGGGSKRAFDSALQEMLNQATIEVNEAEKMKRDSWKKHQEDLRAYRELEAKVKQLYKKLKNSVEKSKPYFEQKKDFDRHLWQLKLRVDSIHLGLSGAKENYSACLKSLEVISDEIHEKRKSKRMEAMIAKLQEREAGVGADSSTEDETSLSASNLDLDFDSNVNFDKLDGISDIAMSLKDESDGREGCEDYTNASSSCPSVPLENRVVYGLESPGEGTGMGEPNETTSKPGTSRESRLEETNHSESAAKLASERDASSNGEISEKDETNRAKDLPDERESIISTMEKEIAQPEMFKQDEETASDEFCVTIAVEREESTTAANEALTEQVETENKQKPSAVEESEGVENQDKKETQSESYETQNEKTNETDVARKEGQNDIDKSEIPAESGNADEAAEDENGKKVVESRDCTSVSDIEQTGKHEATSESESNVKDDLEIEVLNDGNDHVTAETAVIDPEISTNGNTQEIAKNTTDVKEGCSEVNEHVQQVKEDNRG